MRILTPFLALASLALAVPAMAQSVAPPGSDEESYIYLMGASMGRSLSTFGLSEREIALVIQGLEDSLHERKLAVDIEKYGPHMNDYVGQRNALTAAAEKSTADQFLVQAKAVKGAVTTSTGLVYVESKAGAGAKPAATDQVKVHYHGTLSDGTVFDTTRGGDAAVFRLNEVIVCWTEALQRMQPGAAATIFCPAELAYGDRGIPGRIKPGAALKFEVELLAIE